MVADLFSAILVVLAGVLAVAIMLYSTATIDGGRERYAYYPLTMVLLAGVCGTFLTGDLFNLYVWFEVLLIASFVLLALGGERAQLEGALKYVALNLVASAVLLVTIGVIYGLTGTVNLADLSGRMAEVEPDGLVAAIAAMLLVAFGIKAALVPLFFWLPAAYPMAPVAVSALFSGLLTKVGIYALVRVFTLLFADQADAFQPLLLVVAALTMIVGVLGAVAQHEMRRLLSFHIISQIGYLLMGLALFTVSAMAGLIYFLVHVALAKSTLFLISGAVEAADRLLRAGPHRWPVGAEAGPGRALRHRRHVAGGHPALQRLRRQAGPYRGRSRGRPAAHRLRGPGRQPADAVLDAQDLERDLLEATADGPGAGRRGCRAGDPGAGLQHTTGGGHGGPYRAPRGMHGGPDGGSRSGLRPGRPGGRAADGAGAIHRGCAGSEPMTRPSTPPAPRTPPAPPTPGANPHRTPPATMFAGNLLLALLWVAMSGRFDVASLVLGFVFGYLVLFLLQRVVGRSAYFTKSVLLVRFIGFYIVEVVRANLRVAIDVVTPASRAKPAVVAVPLEARTDVEITLLSNLITMTPGSLSIDVADDRSVIYVHSMFVDDPEEFRRAIKDDLERRVLELLR